jgi:hypothetical protein
MAHMPTTDLPDGAVGVANTRTISTTAPLSGGGDLSANRTIALDDGGITTAKLDDGAVTLGKMADLVAARLIGSVAGGTPAALNGTQVTALLDNFTSALKGLVPASGGGTSAFLRADGSFAVPPAGAWMTHLNVRDFGAVGDGVTDDSVAIRDALDDAAAIGGCYVLFPPLDDGSEAIYLVSREGGNSWCIDIPACSGLSLLGVRGLSWLKMEEDAADGLAADTPVALMRVTDNTGLTIRELGFDGNWGNPVAEIAVAMEGLTLPQATITVKTTAPDGYSFPASGTFYVRTTTGLQTVTYTGITATTFTGCSGGTGILQRDAAVGWTDSQTGLNQITQADPKNYLLWLYRGCENVLVENCTFRQAYGDGIWIGGTAGSGIRRVAVRDCDLRVAARNGITISTNTENVRINNVSVKWPITTAFDTEPVVVGARDVAAQDCDFGLWWSDSGTIKSAVSIDGGSTLGPGPRDAATGYRLLNCSVEGSILMSDARDVHIAGCRLTSVASAGYPCVFVQGQCDDIWIVNNQIYDRSVSASPVTAAITFNVYAFSSANLQMKGAKIYGNVIRVRNGRDGIHLRGNGGKAGDSGTATGVTSSSLTDTGKAWNTDEWAGHVVRMGGAQASVTSNTATVLTLSSAGWQDEFGGVLPTPTAGAYTIYPTTSVIDVANNTIDLVNDDGSTSGGQFGVYLFANNPGGRVRVRGNAIRGGDTRGIRVVPSVSAVNAYKLLEITDNHVYDDQATPTCTQAVSFNSPSNLGKLVLRNNTISGGTTTAVNGLTSGTWLIDESKQSTWGGYGTPEGVVTAPIGSMYFRVDGGAGTCLYVKESGAGNTGWIAK